MKPKIKSILQVLLFLLLAFFLASCDKQTKFVAPEIDPPSDLTPSYVPEGFKLVKGYQIKGGEFVARAFLPHSEDGDEVSRMICELDLPTLHFELQSPTGNDILGVHYQKGNSLLLITKSYYPGGSLELWRAAFEGHDGESQDCECNCPCCGCISIATNRPLFSLREGRVQEVRTVGDTQVAVVDSGLIGTTTVFIQGDYLLTVESDISLEEILKIVASLLEN